MDFQDRYKILITDRKTGEVIKCVKFVNGTKDPWEKVVARQLAVVLNVAGSKKTDFIAWLLSSKNSQNLIFGNYSTMAKDSGISRDTIKVLVPKLKKIGFLKTKFRDVYMVNPETIRPGNRIKGSILFETWKQD